MKGMRWGNLVWNRARQPGCFSQAKKPSMDGLLPFIIPAYPNTGIETREKPHTPALS